MERFDLVVLVTLALILLPCIAWAMEPNYPRISHIGAVAPDILAITVETGFVEKGVQVPYSPQPGDIVDKANPTDSTWLVQQGKTIGALVGPDRQTLWRFEQLRTTPWPDRLASRPGNYYISSSDDPAYAKEKQPEKVYRKSYPVDLAQTDRWKYEPVVTHTVYLQLPAPLQAGASYLLEFARVLNLDPIVYKHEPLLNRSEAVHVNQVGFRPDDPVKLAYLSIWLGDGGAYRYPEGLPFQIIDETGKPVYSGKTVLRLNPTTSEDAAGTNTTKTYVYQMDFTSLQATGSYRVCVASIGCSYPFDITPDVYLNAFRTSARGYYHQRSGISLEPPYTTFTRPRPFHPDDGQKVYQSTTSLLESGNGLNVYGTDTSNFANLVKGGTDILVPDAWGGYFDAGDWDRRIQHTNGALYQLELYELFPDFVQSVDLNIPESNNDLPDLVDEALWGIDIFRRMQTADGGIRGGIESAEHPLAGEASWQESLRVYAYAPDVWSSYIYASVASRAAYVLAKLGHAQQAQTYSDSALKAMTWAESHYSVADALVRNRFEIKDARNLAALELWRLTGNPHWHELFLQTTVFTHNAYTTWDWQKYDQQDAAFLYARLNLPGMDEQVKSNARQAILNNANKLLVLIDQHGFNWTNNDEYAPAGWGTFTIPRIMLVRAHALSQDQKYLRGAVLGIQASLGANPQNMSYTTGVGIVSPQNAMVLDSRRPGLPMFPGITVYGPMDPRKQVDTWVGSLQAPAIYPSFATWPAMESYFDVYMSPPTCEFTVMQTLAPTMYTWGYLAARNGLLQ